MDELEQFCLKKKIDATQLKNAEPELWVKWSAMLEVMNEDSFVVQELFLINPTRRKYPLKSLPPDSKIDVKVDESNTLKTETKNETSVSKPKIKPQFKKL